MREGVGVEIREILGGRNRGFVIELFKWVVGLVERWVKVSFGNEGEWFVRGIERVLGDERNTRFWDDIRVEGEKLRVKFSRLYCLSEDKLKSVSEMGEWSERGWEWVWKWRRPLFDREKNSLVILINSIDRFKPSQGIHDS